MSEQHPNTSLDWDRCVICQVETDERLTHPDSGYKSFSMKPETILRIRKTTSVT